MRCLSLRSLVFSAVALLFLAAGVAAADPGGSPTAPSSGEIRVGRVRPAASTSDAADEPAPEEPDKPTAFPLQPSISGRQTEAAKAAVASKPADDHSKAKPADDSLSPISDPQEGPPAPIVAASFKGVAPGTSTRRTLRKPGVQPKKTSKVNGSLVQLYSVEPFKRVEVNYANGKVSSVVIRLDRSFPAEAVAKQLDLTAVRPVLVVNELGEVLGRAYPERGVLLAFEPSDKPGKSSMKVSQIILEPISAESFVLRAETTMDDPIRPEPPRSGTGIDVGARQRAGTLAL